MSNNNIVLGNILTIGAVCLVGGIIVKKLDYIIDEIEYFEDCKGVILNRKEYYKQLKEKYSAVKLES